MAPVGHLGDRGWPWTACWPGGPGAAVLPPPASGGAALHRPAPHQLPPHTAYRERRGGQSVADIVQSQNAKNTVAQCVMTFERVCLHIKTPNTSWCVFLQHLGANSALCSLLAGMSTASSNARD